MNLNFKTIEQQNQIGKYANQKNITYLACASGFIKYKDGNISLIQIEELPSEIKQELIKRLK